MKVEKSSLISLIPSLFLLPILMVGLDLPDFFIYGMTSVVFIFLGAIYLSQAKIVIFLLFSSLGLFVFLFNQNHGFIFPFSLIIFSILFALILLSPRIDVHIGSIRILTSLVFVYAVLYLFFNFENAYGSRSIGGFSENGIIGRFALNFGFGSPARASVILFFTFLLNLHFSRNKLDFVILLLFLAIIATLNRLSIMFSFFVWYYYLTKGRQAYLFHFILVVSIFVSFKFILNYIPIDERIDRIYDLVNLDYVRASFDYRGYIEFGMAPPSVVRNSDFLLTVLLLNFGVLGFGLYLYYLCFLFIGINRRLTSYSVIGFLYIALIQFKNFSFVYDIVLVFCLPLVVARLKTIDHYVISR